MEHALARAVSLEAPNSGLDWGVIIAAIGLVVGGLKWLWAKGTNREAAITARERRYIEKVEARIEAIDGNLTKLQRDFGAVVGASHVLVDQLITIRPASPSLALFAAKLRDAYPVRNEMPSELVMLLLRIDASMAAGEQA